MLRSCAAGGCTRHRQNDAAARLFQNHRRKIQKRIQFTPDLLPSDLTGINFYNQKTGDFQFREGPLFSNIILADEINRATPRTQSSLLEAMEERQISVDGTTTQLEEPFMVMATQNPLENYGTFPLPEAQIDRFFMKLKLGYMNREEELSVIRRPSSSQIVETLECVVSLEEIEQLKQMIPQIQMSDEVADYLMEIVTRTRTDSRFTLGVSTRGAIALYKASQATAALSGRDYVLPEDVRYVTPYVLGTPHRQRWSDPRRRCGRIHRQAAFGNPCSAGNHPQIKELIA